MKLFLASSFEQTATLLEQKLKETPRGKNVIFIANPADYHTGDKWWIKADRDAFVKLGCEIVEVDLRNISKEDFINKIDASDIIHFCGGSVFYTILLLRKTGLDKPITEFVKKNKIIYTGTSAGSMIVSKDLSLNAKDPEEKRAVKQVDDFSGLGLVDFLIMPHVGQKDFTKGNLEVVKLLPKYSTPVIFLYDNQVVWVNDDKFEILSTSK